MCTIYSSNLHTYVPPKAVYRSGNTVQDGAALLHSNSYICLYRVCRAQYVLKSTNYISTDHLHIHMCWWRLPDCTVISFINSDCKKREARETPVGIPRAMPPGAFVQPSWAQDVPAAESFLKPGVRESASTTRRRSHLKKKHSRTSMSKLDICRGSQPRANTRMSRGLDLINEQPGLIFFFLLLSSSFFFLLLLRHYEARQAPVQHSPSRILHAKKARHGWA